MSRHRKAYDDDDLYDDYDYDDYDYDDYAQPAQQAQRHHAREEEEVEPVPPPPPAGVDADLCATFIIESLGQASLSVVRVKQILAVFAYDIEKTVDYFVNEAIEAASNPTPQPTAKATAAAKAPPVTKAFSLSAPSAKASKGISLSSSKPKAVTSTGAKPSGGISIASSSASKPSSNSKAPPSSSSATLPSDESSRPQSSQLAQDVEGLGFDISALDVGVFKSGTQAEPRMQQSALLADHAALSDEEFEPSLSKHSHSSSAATTNSNRLLTLVVAGHVDAGKSTLVGNLLYKTGLIAQRTLHKFQKESSEMGKGSFALAWVMDESESEREHGVTISVAERSIVTEGRTVIILDAPGHRDYIPAMISGAAQADAALLVVPAGVGEFESSVGERAQTREHAILLKALGVSQVLVAVNKMDMASPAWSSDRFEYVQQQVLSLLLDLQFTSENIRFVPVSGLGGENLVTAPAESCPLRRWYSGPSLLQGIQLFRDPERQIEGMPFRAVVKGVVSEHAKGCEVRATALQGRINRGRGVGLASASGAATVRSITADDGTVLQSLQAGETATLSLVDRSGRTGEEMDLATGMVLCKGPPLATVCRRFKATILTLSGLATPIIPGFSFELYLHGEEVPCKIERIYSMVGTGSGGSAKIKAPKCVPGDRQAHVLIVTSRSVCIEPVAECRALGRFALRSKGSTAAVGECRRVGPNT